MKAILTIGYTRYVVASENEAMAVMKVMAKAVEVERDYLEDAPVFRLKDVPELKLELCTSKTKFIGEQTAATKPAVNGRKPSRVLSLPDPDRILRLQ